jgi:N-acetylmuramoyl-L-alanine amidase
LDPGHGGRDTGAIGPTGLREKDVNLDIAFKLRDKLTSAGFKVILTREDDTKNSLDEIVKLANATNADIFISIHNNSHTSRDKSGTETFYFNQSTRGRQLAANINSKTIEQIGTINRGLKTANFEQLKNTKMTSALIECAFISNPDEEAKLNDTNFRDKIATGIYKGILAYLGIDESDVSSIKRLASAQSFVQRVYHRSLNIEPDTATINNWADKLIAETISHADMIESIILSKQFNARNLTDIEYVNVLYRTVLDREPDSDGAAHWLRKLKTLGRTAVLNGFLSSVEFKGLVNQYIQYGYTYTGTNDSATTKTDPAQITAPGEGDGLVLSVLNGVGIRGIAARTSELFKGLKDQDGKDKYNIYKVIDANSFNYQNTKIICKSSDPEIVKAAEEIKTILKVGIITTQKGTAQVSDIVIIVGKDFSPDAADTSEPIIVNVLNGQGAPGIAARTRSKIETELNSEKSVIKVTETKNADSFNYKNTKIIIFRTKPGINDVAEDLRKFLGTGKIIESENNVDNVDITIILGSDYNK